MARLVDLVLAIVVVEAGCFCAWRRTSLLPNLAAGFCLLLALRAGLGAAGWEWIAAALLGAGIAHVADLWLRWR